MVILLIIGRRSFDAMVGYLMPTLGPYVLFDMVRAVLYPSSYTEFNEESGASSDSDPPPWVKENRG